MLTLERNVGVEMDFTPGDICKTDCERESFHPISQNFSSDGEERHFS